MMALSMHSVLNFLVISLILITTCESIKIQAVSDADRVDFKSVLDEVWKFKDLASVFYAVNSYTLLKEKFPIPSQDICNYVKNIDKGSLSLNDEYYIAGILNSVPECLPVSPFTESKIKAYTDTLKAEKLALENAFYSINILKYLNKPTPVDGGICKKLEQLYKIGTLTDVNYALSVASSIKNGCVNIHNQITQIIALSDEVDGQLLQYDGGLSITASIFTGIYQLSRAVRKPPPISDVQFTKFTNYFLSRLSVNTPKGIYYLLHAVSVIISNNHQAVAAVDIKGKPFISDKEPVLNFVISNLFGEPLFDKSVLSAVVEKALKISDNSVLFTNEKLQPLPDGVSWTLNTKDLKLVAGHYNLNIQISNKNSTVNLVNPLTSVRVKISTDVIVDNFQIGILDTEQASTAEFKKIEYGSKLSKPLKIEQPQKLVIKFSVVISNSKSSFRAHQSFVKLTNIATGAEEVVICAVDAYGGYRSTLDLSTLSTPFDSKSGIYAVQVIIGDPLMTSSILWPVAEVELKFLIPEKPSTKTDSVDNVFDYYYKPKPEIKHTFREPERRPPTTVSNIFTGLVFLPLLILFILWGKLGVNINNFPFSLYAIGFHVGLSSIFVLFGIFWLQLNMFQTLKYLLGLSIVTFLCGNKLLRTVASQRKKQL